MGDKYPKQWDFYCSTNKNLTIMTKSVLAISVIVTREDVVTL